MSAQSFDDLARHAGHQVEVAEYLNHNKEAVNAVVECVDCSEILLDFDKEEDE